MTNTLFPPNPLLSVGNYIPALNSLPGNQLLKVNGLEGAKAFQTAPNSMYALFDANDDIMYIKQTDSANYPTITRFRFFKEDEPNQQATYVTVEEFNKFKEEILNGKQHIRSAERKHRKSWDDANGYAAKKQSSDSNAGNASEQS